MEITFVRHGQTEWNSLGKQQGKEDIPLNSRGIEQAKQTAQLLADRQFDRVYCSPLQRAKQTAQADSYFLRATHCRAGYGRVSGKALGRV